MKDSLANRSTFLWRRTTRKRKFGSGTEVRVTYSDAVTATTLGTLRELLEIVELIGAGSRGHGMSSSARAMHVRFHADSMWVDLHDGRTLGVPLAWFPRLLHGTAEQREQARISSRGLHWEALDEDISLAGLLAGEADGTATSQSSAA
jgi:hypothetical protein